MGTNEEITVEAGEVLSERSKTSLSDQLRAAYEDVSPRLRDEAANAFARFHKITPGTFRKKCSGHATVTLQEVEWMKNYRPWNKNILA